MVESLKNYWLVDDRVTTRTTRHAQWVKDRFSSVREPY